MSIISLRGIKKTYEGKGYRVEALKNISLEIEKGEMVALTGKSGSGKSTLLNIIGCIDRPTRGDYLIDGRKSDSLGDVGTARLRNRTFGYVVQDFALIERFTVRENVMLPLTYTKLGRREREKKVRSIIERMGLSDKLGMTPNMLSGGQRQRVSIARALVNDAEIILADEPTGALDSKTGHEIMKLFSEMNGQGKTVVIVTHDAAVASCCGRILTLRDGKLSKMI